MNAQARTYFVKPHKLQITDGKNTEITVYEVRYRRLSDGREEREKSFDNAAEANVFASDMNTKEFDAANPRVGQGGTELLYTDRSPVTVVRVSKSGKKVWVKENQCVIKKAPVIIPGGFAGVVKEDAEWTILPELIGYEECYTYRKNGSWVREGQPMNGRRVTFLYQYKHYDYGF